MIPLIQAFIHAFFYDPLAIRRWVRGGLGALAISGVAFSQQLAALGVSARAVSAVAVGSAFAAFAMQSSAKKTNGNGQ